MELDELFDQIATEVPDVKKSKMFGAPCYKAPNGKAAAMLHNGAMVFKLKADDADVIAFVGVHLFNPMGDRPMSGWYVVPMEYKDKYRELTERAIQYVKQLPKK